jgi:hypothetical protein
MSSSAVRDVRSRGHRDQLAHADTNGIPVHVVPGADHFAAFTHSDDVVGFVRPFLIGVASPG